MQDLKHKVALVTGASTGIGAAVAIAFAAQGMRVAVHYNSSAQAAAQVVDAIAAAGGEAFALQGDVRDTAAIRRVVHEAHARWGGIDVLVNNAGGLVQRVPIADMPDELFDEVLHLNARSVLAFCREVVPLMRAKGQGGSIINVSSVAARHGGGPGAYLYAGAKGFVSTASEKDIQLRFRATPLWVDSDPQLLRRMLSNLVDNAIKYTQRGGVLVVARPHRPGAGKARKSG